MEQNEVSIYIHIPFCIGHRRGESPYLKAAGREIRNSYIEALEKEIYAASDILEGKTIRNIEIGGGIAGMMNPDRLGRLLLYIRRNYTVKQGAEVTIAMSPVTVGTPSLTGLNVGGFNRPSLEALSFNDRLLAWMKAPFNAEQILDANLFFEKFGFRNVNIDLLYGIPGQTPAILKNSLDFIIALPTIRHCRLFPWCEDGKMQDKSERLAQFTRAADRLEEGNFTMYKTGCFAKQGSASDFLLAECDEVDRIGFGLGASSRMDDLFWQNTADMDTYLQYSDDFTQNTAFSTRMDNDFIQRRFAFLKLSLSDGLSEQLFEERFHTTVQQALPVMKEMEAEGLLKHGEGRYILTLAGIISEDDIKQRLFS